MEVSDIGVMHDDVNWCSLERQGGNMAEDMCSSIFMHALEIAVFSSCLNGGRVTAIDGRYAGIEDK